MSICFGFVATFFVCFCRTNPSCPLFFSQPCLVRQSLSHKTHKSHLFKEFGVLEKLIFTYYLCACLTLPFLRKIFLLRDDLQPGLLCIVHGFLHPVSPCSNCKTKPHMEHIPIALHTAWPLPRNKKGTNRLF